MESKEALNEIKNYTLVTYDENREEDNCTTFGELEPNLIEPIEKDLNRLENQDKVLKIIKEKEPDISFLVRIKDLNYYNSCVWKEQELTQEEWDLLKEVFG